MDEKEIIQLLRKQDQAGLELLIAKYKNLACSIALNILGDKNLEDALESVNDAFYDIWRSFAKYDANSSTLKGWVALITRRRSIDRLRNNVRFKSVPLSDFPWELEDTAYNPEEVYSRKEVINRLNDFVEALPTTNRQLFIGRFFMVESIDSLAVRLNISRAALDNRLSRLRKDLRDYLMEGEHHYE